MNNKIFITLFVVTAALIITAGCIQDDKDPLVGTWISGEYTNDAGMHYLKIYETFYPDNTGIEKGYLADESTTQWNHVWINKGDNKYEIYYSPITFNVLSDGKTGIGDSTDTPVQDWELIRTSVSDSIVGKWTSSQKYFFEDAECDVTVEYNEDGTGLLELSNELGTRSYTFTWNELGKDMYVLAMAHKFTAEIKSDGKLYDNFGCVYTKV